MRKVEVDDLPDGWEITELRNAGDVIYGIQAAVANSTKPIGYKILTNINISLDGKIDLEKIRYYPLKSKRDFNTILEKGDLLFNWRSGSKEHVGKTAIFDLDGDYTHSSFILRIRPNASINNLYLYFYLNYLRSSGYFVQQQTYSINAKFNKSAIQNLPIVIPPLSEQQKIASILNKVQGAIEKQDAIIRTTTEIKKALLQKLFTEGLHGEPQKETEIGLMPESWDLVKIGDIADVTSGGTPSREKKEYWDNGTIPWIKTGEVDYRIITEAEEFITEEGLKNSSAKLYKQGTLLMAMYGQGITRGKVAILGIDATINQACAAIVPRDEKNTDTKFLYYFLEKEYEYIRSLGHGANQKNLNGALIKSIAVPLPTTSTEQKQIVNALELIDKRISFANKKKQTFSSLFKTLLHQLMTGQLRVNEIEFEQEELEEALPMAAEPEAVYSTH